MPLSEWAVSGLAVPFLAAFAVAALLGRSAAASGDAWLSAVGALAVGLGYLGGHVAVARPKLPPLDVTDRIPWMVGMVVLLAVTIGRLRGNRSSFGWLWRTVAAAFVVQTVMAPLLSRWFESPEDVFRLVASGGVLIGSLEALDALSERARPVFVGVVCTCTAILSGTALAATGSLTLARLALALSAAVVGLWIVRPHSLRPAATFVFGTALGALLIEGWGYSELPGWAAALLTLAPAGALGCLRIGGMHLTTPEADRK